MRLDPDGGACADGTDGCQGWRVSAPPEGLVLDGRTARRHTESQDQASCPVPHATMTSSSSPSASRRRGSSPRPTSTRPTSASTSSSTSRPAPASTAPSARPPDARCTTPSRRPGDTYGILAWFDSRISNGLIEGINSLVQAAKAKARGYRNSHTLKRITYLIAGKLDLRLPRDFGSGEGGAVSGTIASYVGAAAGTAGGIGAISTFGSVAGVSAAGISSGLASIGALVGGGMVGGVAVVTAAPVILAVAGGYGVYKLAKYANGSNSPALETSAMALPDHEER